MGIDTVAERCAEYGDPPSRSEAVPTVPDVFSAASFFDVINAQPLHGGAAGEPADVVPRGSVVAFYGFKGGCGRTMALAHVATILARRGLTVVAIDLDVEAPGLGVVLGLGQPTETGVGSVALLREATLRSSEEQIDPQGHTRQAGVPAGGGRLLVIPAGRVSTQYLAQIDELGVVLWHTHARSPLLRVIDAVRCTLAPDIILLDCRSGFGPLAATAVFHAADVALLFLPLSEQVWDGVEVFLKAAKVAKQTRSNRPALLLVPTMVPPDEGGQRLLAGFADQLANRYRELVGALPIATSGQTEDEPAGPVLRDGIPYDPRMAVMGRVDPDAGRLGAWNMYQPLVSALDEIADLAGPPVPVEGFDRRTFLDEVKVPLPYADNVEARVLRDQFVPPLHVSRAVDRETALVLGAKGAGKTWLWRYLTEADEQEGGGSLRLPRDVHFVVGHGPATVDASFGFSADALKEIERAGAMSRRQSYRAFWLLYGMARLFGDRKSPGRGQLRDRLCGRADAAFRPHLRALLTADEPRGRIDSLVQLLSRDNVSTESERLFQAADSILLEGHGPSICLAYDGLDTGFETGRSPKDWLGRRRAFVGALLQIVLDWRKRLHRIVFKVFLREDVFLDIEMQNRSHLDPTLHRLEWSTADLWRVALRIATTSKEFEAQLERLLPGVNYPWPVEESALARALHPLWGERIGGTKKKAFTANYVRRRLSDGLGRLFPRSLVQLLRKAVEVEKSASTVQAADRALTYVSIVKAVDAAGSKRLEDLEAEYTELRPYLQALRGVKAVGTRDQFKAHLARSLKGKMRRGLQFGSRGWEGVIDYLTAVGLLGPARRRRPEDQDRLEVAMLYRSALGARAPGLR
ncbi:MAG: ParA family protein [Deltaproteobacteria bacterium]|nr:ParA family protein [Deltaproteobacteria bacterium]